MPGNSWSKFVFTLYSPAYDLVGNLFNSERRKAIDSLELKPGQKVLLDGAGTGIDLNYIPGNVEIHLSDITPAMLQKARRKAAKRGLTISVHLEDSMKLSFEDNSFDAVILHFIVAVVPGHEACLQEAERVVKPGGLISLMDKFLPPGKKEGLFRKLLNPLAKLFFSNISIEARELIAATQLELVHEVAFFPGKNFRRILLRKRSTKE